MGLISQWTNQSHELQVGKGDMQFEAWKEKRVVGLVLGGCVGALN